MPDLSSLFPLILATHIVLAISLLVPSLLLPFTLRNRLVAAGNREEPPGRGLGAMLWLQARGTTIIGAGLAITGGLLVIVLGPRILAQPWLLLSLGLYATAAIVAFAVQRPSLRGLLRRESVTTDADREAWRAGARRQRYVAYGLSAIVGIIGVLMSTKPVLW
ncbi:MAG: DUF2269 family protein [Chloroflexota bacterium]